jgi:hypothetical protein
LADEKTEGKLIKVKIVLLMFSWYSQKVTKPIPQPFMFSSFLGMKKQKRKEAH